MPTITLTPEEIDFLIKDEETCWKLHQFNCEQVVLSEGCYSDKGKERALIAHHADRAQAWEDHVNDNIEN